MFWQHDYESVTWWERRPSCDMETGTGIVTMWPWHGTQAGSQSRTSESLSGCVSGVPCHRLPSPGDLTWSHLASHLGNSHLFTQLNGAEPIWVTEGCLWYEGMSTWWLMVSGRDTIWQGLSTCVNPTCVTCSMSVSTCQTGSRTSDPSHLKYNLGLTIILTKEENRDTSLPRYRDNGNTWSGLSRHLSLCSILPEDIKVSILSCPILCVRTQSIEPLCLFLLKYIEALYRSLNVLFSMLTWIDYLVTWISACSGWVKVTKNKT